MLGGPPNALASSPAIAGLVVVNCSIQIPVSGRPGSLFFMPLSTRTSTSRNSASTSAQ